MKTTTQIPNPTRLHVAGKVGPDQIQRCERCGCVLKDLQRNDNVSGAYPLGARIEISLYHQAMVLSQVGTYCGAVDELTYVSYREQRRLSPHVTPTQWKRVFVESDVDAMEARFQSEQPVEIEWRSGDYDAEAYADLVR